VGSIFTGGTSTRVGYRGKCLLAVFRLSHRPRYRTVRTERSLSTRLTAVEVSLGTGTEAPSSIFDLGSKVLVTLQKVSRALLSSTRKLFSQIMECIYSLGSRICGIVLSGCQLVTKGLGLPQGSFEPRCTVRPMRNLFSFDDV
jgi:hypothetical protein